MNCYIKLVDKKTGIVTDIRASIEKYITTRGLEYFEKKKWHRAYIRIPYRFVKYDYCDKFTVYAVECEDIILKDIVNHRKLYPDKKFSIKLNGKTIYNGAAEDYPKEYADYHMLRNWYDGNSFCVEVGCD